MNRTVFIISITILSLLPGLTCLGHSVHVFAHAENGTIQGEGYLSGGRKVVDGEVQIFDGERNELLLTIRTDKQGAFSFNIDQLKQDQPADLLIVLNAGPGHRSQWELKSDQYMRADQPEDVAGAAESITNGSPDHAPAANPPLINILAGIVCIAGIGGIVYFFKSRKGESS